MGKGASNDPRSDIEQSSLKKAYSAAMPKEASARNARRISQREKETRVIGDIIDFDNYKRANGRKFRHEGLVQALR